MPNDDFIPPNDAAFDVWQNQFISAVAADPPKFGLTGTDISVLQNAQAVWGKAYPSHLKAQADAETATETKNDARASLEGPIRGVAKKIHGTPGMTNAVRAEAGLPARDGVRTSIGAPTTMPLGRVEVGGHYTLILHFVDETTPTRLAKPEGVQGCQVWSFVGDTPPADPSGYSFLALDTRTPYTDVHPAADAGKTVHYLLRWANAKGEAGPWSDVITAKIPG